jgi:hypothetical protein
MVTDGLDRFRESQILLRRVGGGYPHFRPHTSGQKPVSRSRTVSFGIGAFRALTCTELRS